jgi:hypothetical protein
MPTAKVPIPRALRARRVSAILLVATFGALTSLGAQPHDHAAASASSSAPSSWAFAYRAGQDAALSFDIGYSIRVHPDGGFLMAGNIGYKSGPSLTRLRDDGSVMWSRQYTFEWVTAYSMALTANGGSVIAGTLRTMMCCETDPVVMKLDANGLVEWSYKYALPGDQAIKQIAPVADGYILVGKNGLNPSTAWIAKLSTEGSRILWQKSIGKSKRLASAYYAEMLPDGSMLVVGTIDDATVRRQGRSEDVWLFKLNASGNILWQKTFPAAGIQRGIHLHPIPGGTYLLSADGAPDNSGKIWAFVVDGDGNIAGWQKAYTAGGHLQFEGFSMHTVSSGGFIFGATEYTDMSDRFDGARVLLAHLAPDGRVDWARGYDFGDWAAEHPYMVQMVGAEGYIVTGSFGGGVPPGFTPHPAFMHSASQAFLLRVPADGSLPGLSVAATFDVRDTSTLPPVLTKASAKDTKAVVVPFAVANGMTGTGSVVTPLQ